MMFGRKCIPEIYLDAIEVTICKMAAYNLFLYPYYAIIKAGTANIDLLSHEFYLYGGKYSSSAAVYA